jgi:hypothetical protein
MNRRGVLRSAAASVALTVLRRAPAAGEGLARPFIAVIYDERHPEARTFAENLRRHGAAPFPTRGDATGLWYGGALRQNAGAIAGLTSWSDFVIARSCGREFGLRVVFEQPHDPGSDLSRYLDRVLFPVQADPARGARDKIESGRPGQLIAWLLMPRTSATTERGPKER